MIQVKKDATDKRRYFFDSLFKPDVTQETVYDTAARPVIKSIMNGYNGTIFAYGQTGTGKTHTMVGNYGGKRGDDLRGITPRALSHIFEAIGNDSEEFSYEV